jgi:signal transduction histidine kinase
MPARLPRMSLLWKILLSTSIALTLLFAVTAWIVQAHAARLASITIQGEVRTSFQAYESLWRSRAEMLAMVSQVLSRMPDVRAAVGTRDSATIRDSAGEIWGGIARDDGLFLVTDPRGAVIASLGAAPGTLTDLPVVRAAGTKFPDQASGFMIHDGCLYQIAVTPVYVETARGPALLNVLVAGYAVDAGVAARLKQASGGSDFVFTAGGRVVASSSLAPGSAPSGAQLATALLGIDGEPVGELRIHRSFETARGQIAILRRDILLIWAAAMLAGLVLTFSLARRILRPVEELDRAAAEIGRGNYNCGVEASSEDELGRLAGTFNAMCASIRTAREELIRQERIATIGRLSTSLVHDLRNPLAAIYGGAEMLVDGGLSGEHVRRLARNIYRSSQRIQGLLQDLTNVTRGRAAAAAPCRVGEVIRAACDPYTESAEAQAVSIEIDVPPDLELPMERSRMERVFANLVCNALEAMPRGGTLRIAARTEDGAVRVEVEDSGPGVLPEIAPRLFQPFVSAGKKNGLGLGLALSRQTVLDHSGDMWLDSKRCESARFCVKLPLVPRAGP